MIKDKKEREKAKGRKKSTGIDTRKRKSKERR
jgi:hypothetical protein